MRIDFITFESDPDGFFVLGSRWAKILRQLREESPWQGCGNSIEDDKFYTWLKETWQIKVIMTHNIMSGYISAIEVDEASYTMLLLRFPK